MRDQSFGEVFSLRQSQDGDRNSSRMRCVTVSNVCGYIQINDNLLGTKWPINNLLVICMRSGWIEFLFSINRGIDRSV